VTIKRTLLKKSYKLLLLFGILVIFFLGFYYYFSSNKELKKEPVLPMVEVVKASKRKQPLSLTAPGLIESMNIVHVRPRVEGQIKKIHTADGALVKEGDLLITLDDDLLKAQLRQAQSNLAKDQASLELAIRDEERNRILRKKDFVSQAQLDQREAQVKNLEAACNADQAAIDQIKLQISYTQIKSPINGKLGFLKATEGNFVKPTDTDPLLTVAQINPIEMVFSISERYLKDIQKENLDTLSIKISFLDGKYYSKPGKIIAINNEVATDSGTIQLKAQFENEDFSLWSGQYVNVTLDIPRREEFITVPSSAIQIGQKGMYVFIADPQTHRVKMRLVQSEVISDSTATVTKGVEQDELVVTSGQLKLVDGTQVVFGDQSPLSTSKDER
jgi:multidrug efflux system membrane fusion protein